MEKYDTKGKARQRRARRPASSAAAPHGALQAFSSPGPAAPPARLFSRRKCPGDDGKPEGRGEKERERRSQGGESGWRGGRRRVPILRRQLQWKLRTSPRPSPTLGARGPAGRGAGAGVSRRPRALGAARGAWAGARSAVPSAPPPRREPGGGGGGGGGLGGAGARGRGAWGGRRAAAEGGGRHGRQGVH